jgi:hypothetical protein
MNNTQDTFLQLRGKFDGQDPFMVQGHQIIKTRRDDRDVPAWAKNNKQIQKILLHSFPKLHTNARQHAGAARWARIIQLFFRMRMTRNQVAEQMELSENVVRRTIQNIRRAASGRRANGTKPTGRRSGRPRKTGVPR